MTTGASLLHWAPRASPTGLLEREKRNAKKKRFFFFHCFIHENLKKTYKNTAFSLKNKKETKKKTFLFCLFFGGQGGAWWTRGASGWTSRGPWWAPWWTMRARGNSRSQASSRAQGLQDELGWQQGSPKNQEKAYRTPMILWVPRGPKALTPSRAPFYCECASILFSPAGKFL